MLLDDSGVLPAPQRLPGLLMVPPPDHTGLRVRPTGLVNKIYRQPSSGTAHTGVSSSALSKSFWS